MAAAGEHQDERTSPFKCWQTQRQQLHTALAVSLRTFKPAKWRELRLPARDAPCRRGLHSPKARRGPKGGPTDAPNCRPTGGQCGRGLRIGRLLAERLRARARARVPRDSGQRTRKRPLAESFPIGPSAPAALTVPVRRPPGAGRWDPKAPKFSMAKIPLEKPFLSQSAPKLTTAANRIAPPNPNFNCSTPFDPIYTAQID